MKNSPDYLNAPCEGLSLGSMSKILWSGPKSSPMINISRISKLKSKASGHGKTTTISI